MENTTRFPHPHTLDDDYGQLSNGAPRRIETANGAVRGLSQERHSVPYIRIPEERQK
jgi:hypothetical protein